jgi:hypothetical protein
MAIPHLQGRPVAVLLLCFSGMTNEQMSPGHALLKNQA